MGDDTRDIAIETRANLQQIMKMLEVHIKETRDYRGEVYARIDKVEETVLNHHNTFEQLKGAWKAAATIGSIVGAAVAALLALLAKFAGFICIA